MLGFTFTLTFTRPLLWSACLSRVKVGALTHPSMAVGYPLGDNGDQTRASDVLADCIPTSPYNAAGTMDFR